MTNKRKMAIKTVDGVGPVRNPADSTHQYVVTWVWKLTASARYAGVQTSVSKTATWLIVDDDTVHVDSKLDNIWSPTVPIANEYLRAISVAVLVLKSGCSSLRLSVYFR
jgi:hypothetical protein